MKFIEILLVLGLIVWQVIIFLRNRALIQRVAAMYPPPEALRIEQAAVFDATSAEARNVVLPETVAVTAPSAEFAQVVADTNEYLLNNFGAAADFAILKDISERRSEELDEEIQAQIATPLYLGLLGTFLGSILGLLSLLLGSGGATSGGASFLRDEQIIAFLWGVGIAMGGSFVGLLLTLGGNQLLKDARVQRDRRKNSYYTFLQKSLLPKLNSDMQRGLADLRAVLQAFNVEFFDKIQNDFFAKLGQLLPLVGQMTENIVIQKDFLEKLQTIGYTELANATIKVFDRVDQSAASFEKFLGYQTALNHTVQQGTELTQTMAALLGRLKSVEQAAEQLPQFLNQHDSALREMLAFFKAHEGTLRDIRARMEQHLDAGAHALEGIVERRVHEMEAEYQQADARLRQYFATLNDQNIYDKVVRYLQPFGELPATQVKLNQLQEKQAQQVGTALQRLEQRLEADEQIQRQLIQQLERLTRVQADLAQPSALGKLFGQKPKDYFGPNQTGR